MQEKDRRAIRRAGFGISDVQQARVDLFQRAKRGARGHILLRLAHLGAVLIWSTRCEAATAWAALTMWSVTACGWEIMITCEPYLRSG